MIHSPSLYKLFSKCFYYPDRELVNIISNGEVFAFLHGLQGIEKAKLNHLAVWIEDFKTEDELLEKLQVEYTRLFVTAFPEVIAPPYKSYYLENELYGKASGEITEVYHENEFKISSEIKEPADHLALELEFLYRISESGKPGSLEIEFIRKHILSWLEKFSVRVDEHASLPFYPFLVEKLNLFLSGKAAK